MKNRNERRSLEEFDKYLKEKLTEENEEIEIPTELNFIVENAIEEGIRMRNRKKKKYVGRSVMKFAVACSVAVVCMLNISPTFAQAAHELPAAGRLFRLFTFREYHFEDKLKYINVNVPEFVNTGKADLEKRVNQEIQCFVNKEIKNSEENAKEYYDAFIETGGKKEDFIPVGITIDYKIHYMSDEMVSFSVSKCETRFSSYNDTVFYNIDMETGNCMTIREYLGNEYKRMIFESISSEIGSWSEDQKSLLWEDLDIESLITEDMPYYIDENENAVIVFEKYEIAAGAAGEIKFIIPVNQVKEEAK